MLHAAVILALLTLALAWPVPILLARARWTARAPGTALALWQAVALAGGLSMIGALLAYGLIPFGATPGRGLAALGRAAVDTRLPPGAGFEHVFALCCAVILGTHLLLNLIATVIRSERQRRRHLTLVELLSQPYPEHAGTRVIDHAAPIAYCLPGATRSITVLSAGMLDLLTSDELRAVIAHEKAHLRQQHHTVLLAFKSWHSALPWFPIANRAENAVALLVEMLADDQARRVVDDGTLARAIVLVGTAGDPGAPTDALAPLSEAAHPADMVTPRVRRLGQEPLPLPARAAVLAVATALLAVPTALLLLA
ncbi:M56 family metallopeptidase [Cryobacterium tepidiphilum]|uniref:M56 family peptidase n=1 Tax=Cryobacterium tepidiphilum TaxID=2486026 RepID=A0A3M8L1N8_9MICO|nr:M56 family metallopeptidase [Cryobacterium tepidiphilum]RNE59467.1 M56 family peptidase [Cryobacterium tepidiphilum]